MAFYIIVLISGLGVEPSFLVRAKQALSELAVYGRDWAAKEIEGPCRKPNKALPQNKKFRNRGGGCDSTAECLLSTYKALDGLSSQHHI